MIVSKQMKVDIVFYWCFITIKVMVIYKLSVSRLWQNSRNFRMWQGSPKLDSTCLREKKREIVLEDSDAWERFKEFLYFDRAFKKCLSIFLCSGHILRGLANCLFKSNFFRGSSSWFLNSPHGCYVKKKKEKKKRRRRKRKKKEEITLRGVGSCQKST